MTISSALCLFLGIPQSSIRLKSHTSGRITFQGADQSAFNIWTSGSVSFGNESYGDQNARNKFSSSGLYAGVDTDLIRALKGGFVVGLSSSATHVGLNGSKNDGRAATASAYASWHVLDHLFVDTLLGYGDISFKLRRYDGNSAAFMSATRPGSMLFGSTALSYDMRAGALRYAPYVRLDFISASLNAYEEQGAADWALVYSKLVVSSQGAVLGLRGQYDFAKDWGVLSLTGRAEVRHVLNGYATQRLTYQVDPVSTSALQISGETRNGVTSGIGLKAAGGAGLSGLFEYSNTLTAMGLQSQGIRGMFNLAF